MAWKQPAIVFVTALVVRLIHVWQMREAPFFSVLLGDSRGYDEWARRIAEGEWLGTDVFYQAPLYPYFLGAIYTLLGRDLFVVRREVGRPMEAHDGDGVWRQQAVAH